MAEDKSSQNADFFLPLTEALQRAFSKVNSATIHNELKWFWIIKSKKRGVAMFNSHPVNFLNGTVELNGVSRAFWCNEYKELVKVILAGCKKEATYNLYGVELQR